MKRAWLILIVGVLIALASLPMLRRRPGPQRRTTPLGEFELLDVTAAGEVFRDGSWFQRTFENVIPFWGIKLGPLRLQRPAHRKDKQTPLTAWVLYRGTNISSLLKSPFGWGTNSLPRTMTPFPLFGASVLVYDSSGKEFQNRMPYVRRPDARGMLLSVPIDLFPSDEDHFALRFSPPPSNGTNRDWVEFTIQNPFPKTPRPATQTNEIDGQKIVLRPITLLPLTCEVELPAPDWLVGECTLQDGSGNNYGPSRHESRDSTRPPQSIHHYHFDRAIDTNHAWRITLTLARASTATTEDHRIVQLSSDGSPRTITNSAGQIFSCIFDGQNLFITAPVAIAGRPWGWIVTGGTNETSNEPLPSATFSRTIPTLPTLRYSPPIVTPCSNILLHLAYPRTIATQFDLNPNKAGSGR